MRTLPASALVLAAACGGADGGFFTDAAIVVDARVPDAAVDAPIDAAPIPSPNPGFGIPSQETRANQATGGGWSDVGPADWSCLGTQSGEQPSSGTIALTGRVRDLLTGNGVGNADVTARASWMPGEVLGAASSSAELGREGELAMTLAPLPVGERRYQFRLTAPAYLTTYLVETYLAPGQAHRLDPMTVMSGSTAAAMPSFIGLTRDPTQGMLLTTVRDCQGRPVSNAVVALSLLAGGPQHLGDAKTFYFSAGAPSLPVRTTRQPVTNRDGKAIVLDADPALARTAHLQAWGYRTAADLAARNLTLLADVRVPVEPDVMVYTDAPPFQF